MFQIDLSRQRFMKLWRVRGERVDATAAVIKTSSGYTAVVHCRVADGPSNFRSWRTRQGHYLNGREVVRCINSIDRGFTAVPGIHVRIDFPHDATREDQLLVLLDFGLTRLFEDQAAGHLSPLAVDRATP